MTGELPFVGSKRPPLRYHGSKWRLAPWIIQHFPAHKCYVEVFGGSAGVLLRKPRVPVEIYNDLESQVVNFWRVMRDPEKSIALAEQVARTPHAREEFCESYEASADAVESARRFVIRGQFGFGSTSIDPTHTTGFRTAGISGRKNYAREWAGVPEAIARAAERFTGVTVEHLDWRRLIPKLDDPETLFYVDPPYPLSTRDGGGKGYVHDMTEQDHRALAWMLKGIRGKALISGYPCSLYDEIYKGWPRFETNAMANGQKGSVWRRELLWRNF
jgi:DNA adenine methylase